ncbi:lipopolysaccharide biosynthesis protein [Providencia rustigianii]|uniref:lipopolysaccharide biosynthesis protein n=1 Tax=Providencia rustigianii TaxID=158850 RepID=UPI000D9719CF|nr:Polysaccharide biosynthesis protein [Providencia rustigianii]
MNKALIKSLFIYGGSVGITRILPLILLPVYLHFLGSDSYGRIEVIFALFNLLVIFGAIQLETSLQRNFYKTKDKDLLYSAVISITSVLSLLIFFVVTYLSKEISILLLNSKSYASSIILIAITIFLFNISTINQVYLRYSNCDIFFLLLNLIQVIISTLTTYVSLSIWNLKEVGYFLGLFSGWFSVTLISSIFIFKKLHVNFKFNISNYEKILDFALPQLPARILSFFVQFGNRFVVLSILGAESVAKLAVSMKFTAILQLFMVAFSMVWNPYIYKNEKTQDISKTINKTFKIIIIFLIIAHVVTEYFSTYIIFNFFPSQLYDSTYYISISMITIELLIIKEIMESGIKLSKKTKYISYSYTISSIFMLTLMFFSRNLFEIILSTVIGNFILVISTWYFSKKHPSMKVSPFFFIIYIIFILYSLYTSYKNIQ